ncbi:MAG: fimbrial biosis outer rane usher protein [Ramlibacter sp.]|nr:fimbrial biosis outer rane usher protein [Ramlibacter sp.]
MACTFFSSTPAATQPAATETGERVLPVEVTVNGGSGGIWPIVSRDGVLYAPVEAFTAWRLQVRPDAPVIDYRGFRHFPVAAVPGLSARLDSETATLELTVAAGSFAATRLTREQSSVLPRTPVVPAAFLNYDLTYNRTSGATSASGLGLLGELGWSGSWGVLTQTFVGRNLATSADRSLLRLDTSYRRDLPDSGYTFTAGDSVFRTGLLGRPAYFGGLQFGTNFGLAPYINRQPIPLIAGQTSTPSTVQLYVNDVLRQTSNLPAGPFTLDNLPTLSGNGDVTVRVRDILGRETLITQPFLVTADLLASGTNDWSVEVGKLRLDLGTDSAHYGEPFASGMLRRGLSATSTAEGRLELSRTRSALGLAAVHAIGANWLTRAGAMVGRDDAVGGGHHWLLGVERPGVQTSLAATLEGSSRNFRSLGEDLASLPPRLQAAAQASYTASWGRVGLALAVQSTYDRAPVATYSLNYSTTVRANWQLNTFASFARGSVKGHTIGAVLTVPLDKQTSTSTSLQVQGSSTEFYSSVSHSPSAPTGWAWRAIAAHQHEARAEGGAYYISPYGVFSGELSATQRTTDMRFAATGGALWTQNRLFALPRFDGSAALVEVTGYPEVGVGLGAAQMGRTDAGGIALVNRLAAYQKNPIRLDANDLPVSAEIDSIEVEAVPPWRSVAKVDFRVRGGRAALIHISLDDGDVAPAGATVHIEGEDRVFYVARRGEAYVTGLKVDNNRLFMRWRDARCQLDVPLPRGAQEEISRVGPVRCSGVTR